MTHPIRISIFEDHSNLRLSLQTMLDAEPDFMVVSTHPNCIDATTNILESQPDIILMDIDLPEINGIEGVRLLKEVTPEIRIIMLTVFEDDDKIFKAIQAGADGYLLKNAIGSQLIPAIRDTSQGGASISPGIALKVLNAFRSKNEIRDFGLSKRENEMLELLVKGFSYKRIAADSFVSIDTVRSHIKNIYLKLQVNSATEAVAKALKYKLVATE
jgi:DNA-binding NarL/FixJ family response regulator